MKTLTEALAKMEIVWVVPSDKVTLMLAPAKIEIETGESPMVTVWTGVPDEVKTLTEAPAEMKMFWLVPSVKETLTKAFAKIEIV